MCGEKVPPDGVLAPNPGSPPRMRGKENRVLRRVLRVGITPACAGKRCNPQPHRRTRKDHPCTCGEKERVSRCACWTEGSPPHMRGKDSVMHCLQGVHGITPAHAGKRAGARTLDAMAGDHPRTCGEKMLSIRRESAVLGSPPHMRGKGVVYPCILYGHGITPAHAGKSIAIRHLFILVVGSPPHMRGKV